jgi:hypothetical protein
MGLKPHQFFINLIPRPKGQGKMPKLFSGIHFQQMFQRIQVFLKSRFPFFGCGIGGLRTPSYKLFAVFHILGGLQGLHMAGQVAIREVK